MLVGTSRGRGVVPIIPPRGMIKVDDKVAIVRGDRVIKSQCANRTPVLESTPLKNGQTLGDTFVGDFYVENERPFRGRIASVEYLRHHFIAEVQAFPLYAGLLR